MLQINNKVKLLIFLLCVIVLVSTVNATYSRYASAASGTVTTNLARWQIFVNRENITSNYGTSMTFTPTILPNEHVAANKIAPSSKGYFDVIINPVNVDVSFTYDINVNIPEDSMITDIKVTDYAIIEGDEITDDTTFDKIPLSTSTLTNTLIYDNETENFAFSPFIIRMYFAWVDGENETMDDESDGIIGDMVASEEDTKFELGIDINFKQYTGEEETPGEEPIDPTEPTEPEDNGENPDNQEPDSEE